MNAPNIATIPKEPDSFGALNDVLDEKLEIISDELIKKGTLASDAIDWVTVEQSSQDVLTQLSHMLAFRGVILALLEKQTPEDLSHAFAYGAELFEHHFPKLHPQGKKFQRKKDSWAAEIAAALTKAVEPSAHGVLTAEGVAQADRFCTHAQAHGLEVSGLTRALSDEPVAEIPPAAKAAAIPSSGPISSDAPLDAKGRAQLRRDIQSLAHQIFTHMPQAAISYEMRGFAGWMEFQFLPEADQDGKTQSQKMPAAVLDDHERALSTPSKAELHRLEERLISNPDWFEGHHLAHVAAQALGYPDAAEAIRRRVSDRLEMWPDLRRLKYSNDQSFVSDQINEWALGSEHSNAAVVTPTAAVAGEDDDFATVLASVNQQVEAAASDRDKAVAKLHLLRAFKREGHSAQAALMAEELLHTVNTCAVKDWDQQLLRDIEAELS